MIFARAATIALTATVALTLAVGTGSTFAASLNDLPKDPTKLYAALAKLPAAERQRLLVEGATKEGTLSGYLSGGVPTIEAVKKAFETKYPFVKLEYWRGRTAQVVEKVLLENRADKLTVDIIKVSEIHVLQKEGLTTPYSSPAKSAINPMYMGKDWQSLTINPVVPAYNTDLVSKEDAPKSYADFLDPKWKGKILLDIRPDKSMLSIYEKLGDQGGRDFMKKLVANDPIPVRGHTAALKAMAAGEHPLVFEAYGYQVAALKDKHGAPMDYVTVDPMVFIGGLFTISSKAPHPYAAALFTDFLLSKQGQEVYLKAEGRPMVHPEVAPLYETSAKMLTAPNLIPINPDLFRKHEKAISRDLEEIVVPALKK